MRRRAASAAGVKYSLCRGSLLADDGAFRWRHSRNTVSGGCCGSEPAGIDDRSARVYGRNSFRGKDLAFRDRYFERVKDGFALNANVQGCVCFSRGNILDPGLLAGQPPYDCVLPQFAHLF